MSFQLPANPLALLIHLVYIAKSPFFDKLPIEAESIHGIG